MRACSGWNAVSVHVSPSLAADTGFAKPTPTSSSPSDLLVSGKALPLAKLVSLTCRVALALAFYSGTNEY